MQQKIEAKRTLLKGENKQMYKLLIQKMKEKIKLNLHLAMENNLC